MYQFCLELSNSSENYFAPTLLLTRTTCDGTSLINCFGADCWSNPTIVLVNGKSHTWILNIGSLPPRKKLRHSNRFPMHLIITNKINTFFNMHDMGIDLSDWITWGIKKCWQTKGQVKSMSSCSSLAASQLMTAEAISALKKFNKKTSSCTFTVVTPTIRFWSIHFHITIVQKPFAACWCCPPFWNNCCNITARFCNRLQVKKGQRLYESV